MRSVSGHHFYHVTFFVICCESFLYIVIFCFICSIITMSYVEDTCGSVIFSMYFNYCIYQLQFILIVSCHLLS